MAIVRIPYSKSFVKAEIPDKNFQKELVSKAHNYETSGSEKELVNQALDTPIGTKTLEEMVKDKNNMVIITSDHTRPVPSKITLPILLKRIRKANSDIDITILIATGYHRGTTKEEMIDKFGKEIVENERIVNHISWNNEDLHFVGTLPSGGDLWLTG
nr:lactate racemase domain-containing protein [Natranaerobius trueperi]